MPNVLDGKSGAVAGRFAIVVSRYNEHITAKLLAGAVETLRAAGGVSDDAIDVAWVPGAWEIPRLVAHRLALSKKYVAVLCLGAVIKGETTHDEHINRQVSASLGQIRPRKPSAGAVRRAHLQHRRASHSSRGATPVIKARNAPKRLWRWCGCWGSCHLETIRQADVAADGCISTITGSSLISSFQTEPTLMNASSYLITLVFLLAWNAPAPADIPAPARKQENRIVAPVVIRHGPIRGEGRSIQAKIIVPRSLLSGGDADARPIIPPLPGRDEEARSNTPPYGTVVAGLAMSLAAVSLVFVVRSNRIAKTAALTVLSGALLVAGYGIARADLAPHGRTIARLPRRHRRREPTAARSSSS